MKRIKLLLKENYKILIFILVVGFIFLCPLSYYIDGPGGLSNLDKKVIIKNKKVNGSYNMTYVSEYKATIPMIIYAYLKKDFDIYKKEDILINNETDSEYNKRDRLYLKSSLSNAVISSYRYAHKKINVYSKCLYVGYITDNSNTDLKIGDNIISINKIKVTTRKEINRLLSKMNVGDRIDITVINNKKKLKRTAIIKNENGINVIGIIPIEILDYETEPAVEFKMDSNESGSSGGLMLALSIYDLIAEEDLAKGRTIAGTGTIDEFGNVGEVGGIKYKIKGAVKDRANIFFVPKNNYKEAKKIIDKNNYKIKLISINKLDDAVIYLKNH